MNYTNNDNSRATEEEKAELRAHLKEYVETITERSPKGGRFAYVCPLCNSGTGPNGTGAFMLNPGKDCTTWHCFACDRGGDLFDLMGLMDGIDAKADFPRILDEAREMFGRGVFVDSRRDSVRPRGGSVKPAEPEPDYGAYLTKCRANIDGGMAYLAGRGFTAATVERFGLGFDAKENAITIPVNNSRHAYAARYLSDNAPHRYMSHGRLPVFNVGDLYRGEPCFVVEGQFDCMSVVQAGGRAVAIMGSNVNALYRQLEERKPSAALIIAMDADDPGRRKAADMAKRLDALKIPHVEAAWTVPGKDANERLVSDREGFGRDVAANVARAAESTQADSVGTVADYLSVMFRADIARGMGDTTPTGFKGLDDKLAGGLHSGVYVLGAVPSLGKTSLAWQIADNIAAGGRPVLFYSLEMSRFEMVSKAISRHAVDMCGVEFAPSALDVRMGRQPVTVEKAAQAFAASSAHNLTVVEGGLDLTVSGICDDVAKRLDGDRPVVFVDYLQILRSGDPRTDSDDKRRTDEAMRQLKQLSAAHGLVVVVVSSLNRSNYGDSMGFESLKESGGIEYTADTILGLQLRCLTEPDYRAADVSGKRELVESEKQATPRRLRLLCLKNRSGLTGWSLDLDYYPRCDLFRESDGMAVAPQIVRC